jgi:uncharacterized protein with GYD domain
MYGGEKTYIMQISRHSPESCPLFNEQTRRPTVTLLQRFEELLAKHGVKKINSFTDYPGHTIFNIYEAPNMEAFMGFSMEPEMMAWLGYHRVETKIVMDMDQVRGMFGIG